MSNAMVCWYLSQELVVAAFVLALLFFSAGERIFFKAAVDDMAPFRYCSEV